MNILLFPIAAKGEKSSVSQKLLRQSRSFKMFIEFDLERNFLSKRKGDISRFHVFTERKRSLPALSKDRVCIERLRRLSPESEGFLLQLQP